MAPESDTKPKLSKASKPRESSERFRTTREARLRARIGKLTEELRAAREHDEETTERFQGAMIEAIQARELLEVARRETKAIRDHLGDARRERDAIAERMRDARAGLVLAIRTLMGRPASDAPSDAEHLADRVCAVPCSGARRRYDTVVASPLANRPNNVRITCVEPRDSLELAIAVEQVPSYDALEKFIVNMAAKATGRMTFRWELMQPVGDFAETVAQDIITIEVREHADPPVRFDAMPPPIVEAITMLRAAKRELDRPT